MVLIMPPACGMMTAFGSTPSFTQSLGDNYFCYGSSFAPSAHYFNQPPQFSYNEQQIYNNNNSVLTSNPSEVKIYGCCTGYEINNMCHEPRCKQLMLLSGKRFISSQRKSVSNKSLLHMVANRSSSFPIGKNMQSLCSLQDINFVSSCSFDDHRSSNLFCDGQLNSALKKNKQEAIQRFDQQICNKNFRNNVDLYLPEQFQNNTRCIEQNEKLSFQIKPKNIQHVLPNRSQYEFMPAASIEPGFNTTSSYLNRNGFYYMPSSGGQSRPRGVNGIPIVRNPSKSFENSACDVPLYLDCSVEYQLPNIPRTENTQPLLLAVPSWQKSPTQEFITNSGGRFVPHISCSNSSSQKCNLALSLDNQGQLDQKIHIRPVSQNLSTTSTIKRNIHCSQKSDLQSLSSSGPCTKKPRFDSNISSLSDWSIDSSKHQASDADSVRRGDLRSSYINPTLVVEPHPFITGSSVPIWTNSCGDGPSNYIAPRRPTLREGGSYSCSCFMGRRCLYAWNKENLRGTFRRSMEST